MDDDAKRPHDTTHTTQNHDAEILPGSHASWVLSHGEILGYPVLAAYPPGAPVFGHFALHFSCHMEDTIPHGENHETPANALKLYGLLIL